MDKQTTLSWPLEIDRLKLAFIRLAMIWEKPLMAAVLATVIFFGFSCFKITSWQMSPYAYFNYLADAFLHRQLNLWILPETLHDLSLFQGKVYLYWEPLPAILIMPRWIDG